MEMSHTMFLSSLLIYSLGTTAGTFLSRLQGNNGRIVGGVSVEIGDYPYQLSLQIDGSHECGASVISQDWALTAAHCVKRYSTDIITLRAGSSYREEGGFVYKVSDKIVHKDYSYSAYDFDIAVLKVATPFVLDEKVKIISLASSSPIPGTLATATGWGIVSSNASLPHQLQMVQGPVVDHEACHEVLGDIITDTMLCTGALDGVKGVCSADSGGPLVADNVQVGVVSFGPFPCGQQKYPDVYDDVARYRSWITENTGV